MRRAKLASNTLLFVVVALILCAALAVPASAADITVGAHGQFKTIQQAVDAATPGDTVSVAPGTYTENVVVNKPLTITAASARPTVMVADPSKDVFFNAAVTNIYASGSTGLGRTVRPDFFTLHDSNGYAYSVSLLVRDLLIAGFRYNVITHPGDQMNGLLPFEVSQNAKLINLVYSDNPGPPGPYSDFAGNVTVNL